MNTKKNNKKIEAPEYRLYSFVNMYLSDIQRGIQTQHATVEMSILDEHIHHVYLDWARYDKTTIVLNGGNCYSLNDIYFRISEYLRSNKLDLPIALFNEDDASLGGALTAVVVILPRNIYDSKKCSRAKKHREFNTWLKSFEKA